MIALVQLARGEAPAPTPAAGRVEARPVTPAPARPPPTAEVVARPTSPPARPTTPPARPTASPTAARPSEYVVSRDELDAELKLAISSGGLPLRDPAVHLVPPERVALTGRFPVMVFMIPIEIEARLFVDDRGQVQVRTTRVDAVGAQLPDGVAASLGQQIDDEGTRAVQRSLPPGVRARSVRVEAERIVVEAAAS